MGEKVDLSGLTEEEAERVLQVVRRDLVLREQEQHRLSELTQKVEDDQRRCLLLSSGDSFNRRCCMRCFSPFGFLLKRRRSCCHCGYYVCRSCCSFHSQGQGWVCKACHRSRTVEAQSIEWFYSNVRRRFKRYGSETVLRMLYGRLGGDTEDTNYEDSSSDSEWSFSNFCRRNEVYGVAETLKVALRVAEEAMETALASAGAQQEKPEKEQEVRYLQENREQLLQELATSVVQKIIRKRRRLSRVDGFSWRDGEVTGAPIPSPRSSSPSPTCSLWRSRSAYSITSTGVSELEQGARGGTSPKVFSSLRKDSTPSLSSWQSVEHLDTSRKMTRPNKTLVDSLRRRMNLHFQTNPINSTALGDSSQSLNRCDEGQHRESLKMSVLNTALQEYSAFLLNVILKKGTVDTAHTGDATSYSQTFTDLSIHTNNGVMNMLEGQSLDKHSLELKTSSEKEFAKVERSKEATIQRSTEYMCGQFLSDANADATQIVELMRQYVDESETERLRGGLDADRQGMGDLQRDSWTEEDPEENQKAQDCREELVEDNTDNNDDSTCIGAQWKTQDKEARRQEMKTEGEEELEDMDKDRHPELETERQEQPGKVSESTNDAFTETDAQNIASHTERPPETPADINTGVSPGFENPGPERPAGAEVHKVQKVNTAIVEKGLSSENITAGTRTDKQSEVDESFQQSTRASADVEAETRISQADKEMSSTGQSTEDIYKKHCAASLCSITAEVLKMLNATEQLIREAGGEAGVQTVPGCPAGHSVSGLDGHLSKLEERVYLAAGTAYRLEGELGQLEESARNIRDTTPEDELVWLEEQVADAAAQVHRSELQVSGIAQRIWALKSAGLDVAPALLPSNCSTKSGTLDTTRWRRRKLPAPPKESDNTPVWDGFRE